MSVGEAVRLLSCDQLGGVCAAAVVNTDKHLYKTMGSAIIANKIQGV